MSIIINAYKFAVVTERKVLYEIGEGRQMSSRRLPPKYNTWTEL